jgi:hypothetical protein
MQLPEEQILTIPSTHSVILQHKNLQKSDTKIGKLSVNLGANINQFQTIKKTNHEMKTGARVITANQK